MQTINRKKKLLQWFSAVLGISAISVLFFAWNDGVETFKMCITTILVLLGIGTSVYAYYKNRPELVILANVFAFMLSFVPIFFCDSYIDTRLIEICRPHYNRIDSILGKYEENNKDDIESIRQDIKNDFHKSCLRDIEFSIDLLCQEMAYKAKNEKNIDKHQKIKELQRKQIDKLNKDTERLKKRDEIYLKSLFVEPMAIYHESDKIYQQIKPFINGRLRKKLDRKIKIIRENANKLRSFTNQPQPKDNIEIGYINYHKERDKVFMQWLYGCQDFVKTMDKILEAHSQQK